MGDLQDITNLNSQGEIQPMRSEWADYLWATRE